MNRVITLFFVVVSVALAVAAQEPLSPPKFIPINIPGVSVIQVVGINNAGIMVGSYEIGQILHGFVLVGSKVTTIDFPGAEFTGCAAINSSGAIVGTYFEGLSFRGFLFQNGQYTDIGPLAMIQQPTELMIRAKL